MKVISQDYILDDRPDFLRTRILRTKKIVQN